MFRLCFLLTTITVSLLFSDFCFNYVMRIKGIYWPDRPLDIIKNVLLPKERQVETNKFILILSPETTYPWVCGILTITYKSCCKLLLLDTQIRPLCLRSSKIVFNYISSYQAVQQSDFSKNFPLNGIHPNFFASFFLLITVRLDICSSSAICATVNPL